jgi:integrase
VTSKVMVSNDTLGKAVDLESLLVELMQERIKLQQYAKNNNHILFGTFMENWLEIHRVKIQDTTYSGYQSIIKKYISPYFNAREIFLDELTPETIQKYYSYQLSKGLSSNTVLKHHANIRTALDYAFKHNMIPYNTADKVELPKKEKYIAQYYTVDEINQLLLMFKNTRMYTPVLIASTLGLRRSEVLGLQWDSIDFEQRRITIQRKTVYVQNTKEVITRTTMKNKSSRRSLPIPGILLEHLMWLYNFQAENRKKLQEKYCHQYNNFVCVDEFGRLLKPNYLTCTFKKITRQHNFKSLRFHDLRHSCASILISMGYSIKEIQEWLGHSDYNTTADIYAHIDYKAKVNMAQDINSVIKV